jgi:molecular chaperone DnaK
LKEAHKAKDLGRIDVTMGELNTAWQAASEDMYKAQQPEAGANGNGAPHAEGAPGADGKKEGEVTDVDFEEVKDDKK